MHGTNPSRLAGRTGFEGGFISSLNFDLAELLRSIVKSGGGRAGTSDLGNSFAAAEEVVGEVLGNNCGPRSMEASD